MTEQLTETGQFRRTAVEQSHFRFEDAPSAVCESFVDGAQWAREQTLGDLHPTISTTAELDLLPAGAVLRGLGNYGGVWQVTDEEDLARYASAADNSYDTSSILLDHCGPFELLWAPSS